MVLEYLHIQIMVAIQSELFLNINDIIYVNVGGTGQSAKSGSGNISYGGYNGGGNGVTET